MSFTDRTHIFRKSDPLYKNKSKKEPNNNDPEYNAYVKRRGASLIRSDFNRQNSLNNSGRDQSLKRNSVLDPSKLEGGFTGGTKFINFIKSGFHLSKSKSKSKANLQENRQSIYNDSFSSKSEENLLGFQFENYHSPIRASNLILNTCDPTLYTNTLTSDGEFIYKPLVTLCKDCIIQPVHPSIVSGQNYCFQIIKRQRSAIMASPLSVINANSEFSQTFQITKSCSYNSSFREVSSDSRNFESVNIIRCQSAFQRNEWIMKIKKHIYPNIEHSIRHEDILKIWIQEAKNLLPKKRYFCEIKLDQILYGRTTVKRMNEMVFWGEEFEFVGLENVNTISVVVYKIVDAKRKRNKAELVGLINLPCGDVLQNSFTEKWYSPSADIRASSDHLRYSNSISTKPVNANILNSEQMLKCVIDSTPMLRIKARYQPLEIIPTQFYQPLVDYLLQENISLVLSLENHLKVKSKEEFVNTLLVILQIKERHTLFLSDIIVSEVHKADDNLILRGNSMASKAMESYLKIIGEKYILSVLSDMIEFVTTKEIDCEVDPLRIQNLKDSSMITNNQKKLLSLVEGVWSKIYNSSHLLPADLKSILIMIRDKLSVNKRVFSNSSHMIDQVISSCLFLRFICPAIMSPFLFGLSTEYSDKSCINRTFTLIAKCIQSLANFSPSYQGKEVYMGFLHDFLTKNTHQMRGFLKQISTKSSFDINDHFIGVKSNIDTKLDISADLDHKLAELSYQMTFHLREIPVKEYTPALTKVRSILENISKIFPNESECSNKLYSYNNFRSQIPVSIYRRTSTTSLINKKSLVLSSIPCSPNLRKDVEEDFSYIPDKYSDCQLMPKDLKLKINNEDYVDFECITVNEPFLRDISPHKPSQTKLLNEQEINDHWTKVVTESSKHSEPGENFNSCTINSSGYESLNYPPTSSSQHDIAFQTLQCKNSENLNSIPCQINSSKLAPTRQANIYRRIKRNSNINTQYTNPVDIESLDKNKKSQPNIVLNRNVSFDTLDSIGNLSGSENNSLHNSQSMSSVYHKKKLNIQKSYNGEHSYGNHSSSKDDLDSSIIKLFHQSSKSLVHSISSNVDLDPFVLNELTRLQLFFDYFNVQKPSTYQGTAVEQYKCKTLDENYLKQILTNKFELNRHELIKYMKASYRLLKSINKSGPVSSDIKLQSIMEINKKIQLFIREEYDKEQLNLKESFTLKSKSEVVNSSKIHKTMNSFSLSTQSLPSPLNKYSKQSPKNSPILARSREANSTLNLSKNLIPHDVFDPY